MQSVQKGGKKEIFSKVWLLLSQEWPKESSLKFECGLPLVEGTFIINLMPLGSSIMELRMRENREFVVPVNILTLFACAPFSWSAQHTTVCLGSFIKLCNILLPLYNNLVSMSRSSSLW